MNLASWKSCYVTLAIWEMLSKASFLKQAIFRRRLVNFASTVQLTILASMPAATTRLCDWVTGWCVPKKVWFCTHAAACDRVIFVYQRLLWLYEGISVVYRSLCNILASSYSLGKVMYIHRGRWTVNVFRTILTSSWYWNDTVWQIQMFWDPSPSSAFLGQKYLKKRCSGVEEISMPLI